MKKLLTINHLLQVSLAIIHCTIFITVNSFGQSQPGPTRTASIVGAVVDSVSRQPLLEASVSLVLSRDSSLVTFGITDGDGRFVFKNIAEGQYRVIVTYVGYQSRSRRVSVTKADPSANAGTLELRPQANTLNEVAVQGEKAPMAVKGDTLEFNAGSFKTQPNAQVEDLLKKLPGVQVDRDGTITAQGQSVKKILVDGKPFFGNDPKMATRNLPADIIDKVQLFDQQSEQSAFSGVDDGDREKTINITTKKDKRKGTFGQQSIAAGPKPDDDARYSAKATINRFNNGQQLSILGMANNINQQGFTGQDLGLGSNFGGGSGQGSGGNPGGGGNLVRSGGGGNGGGGNSGGGGNGQVGNNAITKSWAGGLNFRDTWGKKVDLAGSYNASNTGTLTNQSSRRENVLPNLTTSGMPTTTRTDSSFVRNQINGSENNNTNHRVNLRLDYRLDSLTTIRVIPNLSWLQSNYMNQSQSQTLNGQGVTTNTSNTNYNSTGNGVNGNNSLLLFRKFRKQSRTFSLNWNTAINNQDNEGFNKSFTQSTSPLSNTIGSPNSQTANGGLFAQTINQRNDQQTRSMTNSVNISYTEPLSLRQTLEFHYTLSNNRNTSDRVVADFNETTGQYDRPNTALSNNFINVYMTNRGGLTWQTRRLKYTYALGLDAQEASLNSTNLTPETSLNPTPPPRETNLNRTFANLLPNALFTYRFAKNTTLRINYRTRINAPSVNQLQPVRNNTNPLNIQLGNADLQPEYSHNLSFNFNRFNPSTFRNLFASINASRTDNKIVNSTMFMPSGEQTTRPVNTDGYYTVNGFLVLGRPVKLREQRVNINLNTNLTYNRGTSFVNNRANLSQNWLIGQGLSLNTNIDEKLDLNLAGNINIQSARYSLQPQQNTTFLNQSGTLDLYYQLPLRFTFTTNVTYNHYGGASGSYNQSFTLLNVALARQLFKQKQGELRLSVFDLLNQNQSIVRNVTDTYVEEVQSRVLNRYFTLSFVYNLRKFGAGFTPPTNRNEMPGGRQGRGGFRRNG